MIRHPKHTKTGRAAVLDCQLAILLLRQAREMLDDAPHARAKVQRALKSAEGALRHAAGRQCREEAANQ